MKRGDSGLSLVVGVDKPVGLTSHDVVARCRRIFGEKRVGHTGTLDPLASGALAICVGPATRLDAYLQSDDKAYEARIVFGIATDTDDAEGQPVREEPVPARLYDEQAARRALEGFIGPQSQMPPLYSAVKVDGVKGYEAARRGRIIELQPRDIEVYSADLQAIGENEQGRLYWDVRLEVSKGTYIRSIARDLGRGLGTAAHVGALRRIRCGVLDVADCVTLEALEADAGQGWLDPVAMMGHRVLFADEHQSASVANGAPLRPAGDDPACGYRLFSLDMHPGRSGAPGCLCAANARPDPTPLERGEIISIVSGNELLALYGFDIQRGQLRSRCGFSQGVSRGSDIQTR